MKLYSSVFAWLLLAVVGFGSAAYGQDSLDHANALSRAFRSAAAKTSPAVVTVLSRIDVRKLLRDPERMRREFPDGAPFDLDDDSIPEDTIVTSGVGSGVIISDDGIIITNNHVVADADSVVVRLGDGREFQATDVRTDPLSDLAVIRVKAPGKLPKAALGDSAKMEIGDWVIAIGSPFELEATVSAGIISGKGRSIEKIQRGKLIQTDAAINPGNSGGPLVNLAGKIVGINTAIASSSGGYQGIGFAIPSNRVLWVSKELLEHNRVRRAYLGIRIDDIDAENSAKIGLPPRSGVLIVSAIEGGSAKAAGLQGGDVILTFAGSKVASPRDLQDVVEQSPVGSKQKVVISRDGKRFTADVEMKPLP